MKELELTSNAALTDAVYETALNGSFLEVKLVAGSVGDDEPRGMQPEYECYHISYPDKKDTILFLSLIHICKRLVTNLLTGRRYPDAHHSSRPLGIHGSPTCELVYKNAKAALCGDRKLGLIKYVMALMLSLIHISS